MKKLERKRKGLELLIAPFPIAGVFLAVGMELKFPLVASFVVSGIVLVIASVLLLRSSRKPAAWIEHDVLKIRGGFSSTTEILLKDVESMRYKVGEKIENRYGNFQRDSLLVKMKGYEEWDIPVTDEVEHLEGHRLYHFIKNNFYDLLFCE